MAMGTWTCTMPPTHTPHLLVVYMNKQQQLRLVYSRRLRISRQYSSKLVRLFCGIMESENTAACVPRGPCSDSEVVHPDRRQRVHPSVYLWTRPPLGALRVDAPRDLLQPPQSERCSMQRERRFQSCADLLRRTATGQGSHDRAVLG